MLIISTIQFTIVVRMVTDRLINTRVGFHNRTIVSLSTRSRFSLYRGSVFDTESLVPFSGIVRFRFEMLVGLRETGFSSQQRRFIRVRRYITTVFIRGNRVVCVVRHKIGFQRVKISCSIPKLGSNTEFKRFYEVVGLIVRFLSIVSG